MSHSSVDQWPGVLVGCASMATALDPPPDGPVEVLNITDRRAVEAVHVASIRAGARFIQTNTFAANRVQLAPLGWDHRVWDLNVWGVKVARAAREVAGEPVMVAGTIGPLTPLPATGDLTFGRLAPEAMAEAYAEQVAALLAGGVDFFLIETQADAYEAAAAVNAVRAACRLPVAVSFSFAEGDRTLAGQSVAEILDIIGEHCPEPPEFLGPGCAPGPVQALRIVESFKEWGWSGGLCATPDAGPLTRSGGHHYYVGAPATYARQALRLAEAGVGLLAGCCGTTPEHIRGVVRAMDSPGTGTAGTAAKVIQIPAGGISGGLRPKTVTGALETLEEPEQGHRPESRFLQKLRAGFGISVELDPPRGTNVRKFLSDAAQLAAAGVDAINVGDSPMARVRMGALTASYLIQQETGVETILHFTTRDRNLMAIQADLLSAHALGIPNVLALTGDHPRLGNTKASPVYDIDSIGLLEVLAQLNEGRDINGNNIGGGTCFTAACALSPYAADLDLELERLRRKLAAGAHFIMTQPLYEAAPLLNVLERLGGCPVPIVLGVMPLHSGRHAHYLHNEVPGISIPQHVRDALDAAGDRGLEVGLELAAATVAELRPWIAGVYVVVSFGKVAPVAAFVERLREEWG